MDKDNGFFAEFPQEQGGIMSLEMSGQKDMIWNRMAEIACWNRMDEETAEEQRTIARECVDRLWEEQNDTYCMSILLKPFGTECIGDGFFCFGKDRLLCSALKNMDAGMASGGYLYALCAPKLYGQRRGEMSLLQQYYTETFQIACMDVARGWLREFLQEKNSTKAPCVCSPSFGPGFYGMRLEDAPVLLGLFDAGRIGIRWEKGCMHPQMSLVGIYLIGETELLLQGRDCKNCIGGSGGCDFCAGRRGEKNGCGRT